MADIGKPERRRDVPRPARVPDTVPAEPAQPPTTPAEEPVKQPA